jgi:hypothetical protein
MSWYSDVGSDGIIPKEVLDENITHGNFLVERGLRLPKEIFLKDKSLEGSGKDVCRSGQVCK